MHLPFAQISNDAMISLIDFLVGLFQGDAQRWSEFGPIALLLGCISGIALAVVLVISGPSGPGVLLGLASAVAFLALVIHTRQRSASNTTSKEVVSADEVRWRAAKERAERDRHN